MSFFSNDYKRAAEAEPKAAPKQKAARGHIPIALLNQLSCKVCPSDKNARLKSPKVQPEGPEAAPMYLLSNRPTVIEDASGDPWRGIAGRAITSKLHPHFLKRSVRLGHIVQCAPDDSDGHKHPAVSEIECCRLRATADIERTRPLVVVGVGDEPLHWATGLPRNATNFRGTMIATRIGDHACWYYPILYPNYTNSTRQRQGKSEYEMTLEHDLTRIERMVESGNLAPPRIYDAPYDGGIEYITGQEAGDAGRLDEALHWLLSLGAVAMDVETNGIRPYMTADPKIWTAAIGTFERTVAFSVDHPGGWGSERRRAQVRASLGEFIAQSGRKRCHNVAFEQEWAAYLYGDALLRRTEWEDTMAMGNVLDGRQGIKSLDVQCRIHFGFFLKAQSRVDVSQSDWINRHGIRDVLRYNGMDTKWTDRLADDVLPVVEAEAWSRRLYENKMRLAPTLVLTSARGFPIDFDYADRMVADIGTKLEAVEGRLKACPEVRKFTARFGTFSPTNSDHHLKLLRDVCGRDEVKRTTWRGDSESTDEAVLSSLPADEVPSAPLILEHRVLTRCVSTYLQPLVDGKMTGPDGMIHAEYQSMVTVTGRLSSEMHNWPKHKHREVRGAVAAPDGHWLLAADYGQIEFRVAGMLSGDENLVKYCWTSYDVHKFWAERMVEEFGPIKDYIVREYGVDWDRDGMKTLRQAAKNGWVFPQLFGATSRSCAARMHIPEDVADPLGAEFWDEFKGVKRWQERVMRGYEKNLYVETLGGYRRRGPSTRNELINMPIQGTACEIVLEAMSAISEIADAESDAELQPAFNGHDDLTYVVSDAGLEEKTKRIALEMCRPRFDYINVPLVVEVSAGARWHELREIGKYSSTDLFDIRDPYR